MSSSRVLHSQIISAIIHCTGGFDKAIRVLLTESLSLILFPLIAIKQLFRTLGFLWNTHFNDSLLNQRHYMSLNGIGYRA